MLTELAMPQMGETVTEGTVTRWLKLPGDAVDVDEPVLEISTDKVDSEIPSPVAGFVLELLVDEGETVPVGTSLAVIGDTADQAVPARPTPAAVTAPAAPSQVEDDNGQSKRLPPRALTPDAAVDSRSKFLSPVVRRLVGEHGIDPSEVRGTGDRGRLTRADVLAYLAQASGSQQLHSAATVPSGTESLAGMPSGGPSPPASERAVVVQPWEGDEVVPFTSIRRLTAEHMVRSLATSAHTLVVIDVDYQNVERSRRVAEAGTEHGEGVKLSFLPFVARAVIDAIEDFPRINAAVGDDQLVIRRRVNLGIAVDLDFEGLIVPVVHDADTMRLAALAAAFTDVAHRARDRRLAPSDVADGTFTITNAGGYGTLITGPIINQPQVAILSTDGVRMTPVAIALPGGGHGVAVHPVGNLALSFDHRANDGAYASAFLARVKEILETRTWSDEL
ncbi:MAG: Dihydrolipoyllysine-residue succinyltransferase component of 2-oxoglutarate dehydrogenase complex [Acidimicrobiales bacterium]|nr:MAG: 2-oxo acid dehydrogenase subunit E2 [Actinomycetota bacterium]MBV6510270.1 Dihydrolipoyllysine-residue succinyltransferase component of 2-oxoglutarate dehydrogenase complex [Acidimicrobiales bacterium]RIK02768.1 MAG: dihydrolipoyllysine-residue succinyltransferase [Acidobacteriota bacterium]